MDEDLDAKYVAFMEAHEDELNQKAAAAASTPCPPCGEPLSRIDDTPWLICVNKHKVRCWTDAEINVMEKEEPAVQ